jgi:hypothetical protein
MIVGAKKFMYKLTFRTENMIFRILMRNHDGDDASSRIRNTYSIASEDNRA